MSRILSVEEMVSTSGAGANSATERVGSQRNSGNRNSGSGTNSGGDSNCPPYMNPDFKNCLNGIVGGIVGGSLGGASSAIGAGIGGGISSCFNDSNAGGYGNYNGGQCTW